LAYRAGRVSEEELRALGINVDNAPVVDVNINPLNQADGIRAYGDNVGLVSRLTARPGTRLPDRPAAHRRGRDAQALARVRRRAG